MPANTSARLYSFATKVTVHSEWTDDLPDLAARVGTVASGGNTALFYALDAAVRDIAQRENPRAVLVFTDGQDNRGGPALEETVDRCREYQVTLWTVGLATTDLDSTSLQWAADRTGGSFLTAENISELPKRFDELAAKLIQPAYRATLLAPDAKPVPIRLTIGGTNQVCLHAPPLRHP